ncbi:MULTISPECIES: hypothetical protein [Gordonibacter]|uniref:Uncharacterized protein n=1 Tax=Gordonibacter urolithinfaciens TaxID=1335613 RepID=A0A6N8IMK2_9ACTN|nr:MULTISPECIES: hypothetical protein [Gordonibacter]MVM56020.1 hypothetical protein [Gordonibacter urolithinfaciens]MVN16620.1 hypothetical protein [Gordonibacter urolithinfaciens]MVN40084.1 hypothetical protein [Gordonibacter urolithinfaciens]MVN56178.1 hypothetical protein [Gordonibacter urolithinfaciens]MVN61692.1 hypothetical protein [Gordonibacter urolithinfaciens]
MRKTLFLFHAQASRFMRSTSGQFKENLATFLRFLEEEPMICEYVNGCLDISTMSEADAESMVDRARQSAWSPFEVVGGTTEDEVARILFILRDMRRRGIDGADLFFYRYGHGSRKYDVMVGNFLKEVAFLLIEHIENHLKMKGIEMGLDQKGQQIVTVEGSSDVQIVAASGSASITGNQSFVSSNPEIENEIAALREIAMSLAEEDKGMVLYNVQVLEEQAKSGHPVKAAVATALGAIKKVGSACASSAQVLALVDRIEEFFSPFF